MKTRKSIFIFLFTICSSIMVNAHAFEFENNVGVRMNPIAVLGATFSGDIPVRINKHLAVGPMFTYQDFSFADNVNRNKGVGLRVDWHFNEAMRDGGYLSFQTTYADLFNSVVDKGKTYTMDTSGWSGIAVIGYLWRWDNVTFNLGIGAGLDTYGNTDLVAADGEVLEPIPLPDIPFALGGDFTLGWAF